MKMPKTRLQWLIVATLAIALCDCVVVARGYSQCYKTGGVFEYFRRDCR